MINFLLTTEIIPLCLRIMESGSELSKTVATFILQKILLDETGLNYICQVGGGGARREGMPGFILKPSLVAAFSIVSLPFLHVLNIHTVETQKETTL